METRQTEITMTDDNINFFPSSLQAQGRRDVPQRYIATQAPLSQTVADFWEMVWENGCEVIVMAVNWSERGIVSEINTFCILKVAQAVFQHNIITSYVGVHVWPMAVFLLQHVENFYDMLLLASSM